MKVAKVLIGIVALVAGILAIALPEELIGLSIISLLLVIVMVAWGIAQIVTYFRHNKEERKALGIGAAGMVCGIILLVFCLLIMFNDSVGTAFDVFLVIFFAVSLFIHGIDMMVSAIAMHKTLSGGLWVVFMILGGLLFIAGVLCMCSLLTALAFLEIFFGIGLVILGVSLLCSLGDKAREKAGRNEQ